MYKRDVVMSGVVSLTMGNSALPFGHGLAADAYQLGQLFLRHPTAFALFLNALC